ncbi:G2/mitotic-specific cyclin C13-1 [Vitis vinifera]|uniref:G2/mitotic-specific cyclin C13-1 n=1 Tax=Vitis vinifera TaxID=29760 RepID=A0A438FN38_VITVI|nr:G2/mitotic-specific cyclin C13-1 [Vitis vinifera]
MAEQDNCVHTPGAFRKRASDECPQSTTTKKRVVLEDITNSPNNELIQNSDRESQKPKRGIRRTGGCSSIMYQHLHALEMEEKRRARPDYMEKVQNDVTPNMREILVDWLVEVAEEYKLVSDTLFLCISYIDRFLSSHALRRDKLQLLGVSCMLIASKFEEISPPHAEDFCYITDNHYTAEESLSMQFEALSWYLAELSLLDYGCLQFLPSMIAASSIFLARFTLEPNKHPWSLALQRYSGYKPSELKECVLLIHSRQLNRRGNSSLRAIRQKYLQPMFKCVAAHVSLPEIPKHCFEAIKE